jgi:transcription elongation factor GreA
LVHEASDTAGEDAAHHLVVMLGQNRGLKSRARQKLQDVVLRVHPLALREHAADADAEGEEAAAKHAVYMTAEGLEQLRAERDQILNVDIPANSAEIARAREFGDLSENAEYHAAREKHSLLEAKANALKADVARAVEIKPDLVRTDAVSVGSRVRLRDAAGHEITYTLFGPPDADMGRGIISYLTPLGQALMGRAPGDHVRLDIEGDVRELEVLGIESGLAPVDERAHS